MEDLVRGHVVLFISSILCALLNSLFAVIGGEYSNDGQFPYTISLLLSGSQFCAGVLVDLEYVLSTCHCVGFFYGEEFRAYEPDYVLLVGGDPWVTTMKSNAASLQRRQCDMIIIHPNCTETTFGWGFDYSLLKATRAFYLTPTLQPMEFPFTNPETINLMFGRYIRQRSDCLAIGWGNQFVVDRRLNIAASERLKVAFVHLLPWKNCLILLCNVGPETVCEETSPEFRTKACAVGMGASDTCSLDDGGPVVCQGYVLGLVSKGLGCQRYRKPRIIVRIDFAMGFIREIIERNLRWKVYPYLKANPTLFARSTLFN